MKVRFRHPGWLPTCAALVGVALTLAAAYWQYGRASFKQGLERDYLTRQSALPVELNAAPVPAAEAVRFRKVIAIGHYLPEHTILLDNRLRDGVVGYEVVTPLQLSEVGSVILVNRGWVRVGRERSDLPKVDTPSGQVVVSGTAVIPGARILELSESTIEGVVWQNLVLSRYRALHKLDVAEFVIEQENDLADGLVRRWTPPGFGIRTHQTYAVQWLIFGLLIVIFYVYYGFIRRKPDSRPQ